MPTDPDHILRVAMALADAIVAGGWLILAAMALAWAQSRLASLTQAHGPLPAPPNYAFAWMAAALLVWPVGLIAGPIYMNDPDTARMGRNVLVMALTNITVTVLGTCAAMYWLASRHPDWFHLFLPTL
jgi:hypothetical protein